MLFACVVRRLRLLVEVGRRQIEVRQAGLQARLAHAALLPALLTALPSADRYPSAHQVVIDLNRELGLEDHPETIHRLFAVEFAVSTLKPAYAAVSVLSIIVLVVALVVPLMILA